MKSIFGALILLAGLSAHADQVLWQWQPAYTDETQSTSTGSFALYAAIAEENIAKGTKQLTTPNKWGGWTTSLVDSGSKSSISCLHRTKSFTESMCVFPSKIFGGSIANQLVLALGHRWGKNHETPGFNFFVAGRDINFHDKFGGGIIHCHVEGDSLANMKSTCRIEK